MATCTVSYELVTIVEAHNELQRCERNVESARRWVNDLARKGQRLDIAERRLDTAEKCLLSAKKKYRALAREVRVFSLATGELIRVESDGCRALQEVGVNEVAYERQAEAAAAAMYENGVLDI